MVNAHSYLGNPGAGKTVLAAATVQELEKSSRSINEARIIVCYFFFSYAKPETRSVKNAYRSILAQVLRQCRQDNSIVDIFSFATYSDKSAQRYASEEELIELLSVVSQHLENTYLILDGIDECDNPDIIIKKLTAALEGSNVKVVLFSRPNVHILMKAVRLNFITIERAMVEADLKLYFLRQVESLQDDRLISTSHPREDLVTHLLSGADGMFMWARLMISYLKSPALGPESRLASIKTLNSPENLDHMYVRILLLIAKRIKAEQMLARKIFLWLTYGRYILTTEELKDIATPLKPGIPSNPSSMEKGSILDEFVDFEYTVVMVCASLVERSHNSYRFIHQSVYEFFRNWSEFWDESYNGVPKPLRRLLAIKEEAEGELAIACLSYLLFRSPAQPLSGDLREKASAVQLNMTFPFIKYASTNWAIHLRSSATHDPEQTTSSSVVLLHMLRQLSQTISTFLSKPLVLMSWIESLYTFAKVHDPLYLYEMMQAWSKWAQSLEKAALQEEFKDVPSRLFTFVDDLTVMHRLWGPTLRSNPHQIWNDLTAFTPSPFLMQTAATSVRSVAALEFGNTGLSSKPLTSISVEGSEDDTLGVLSVWPSRWVQASPTEEFHTYFDRCFEIFWTSMISGDSYVPMNEEFAGWVAHFEIWKIDTEEPRRLIDHSFTLDQHEVEDQVRNFLTSIKLREKSRSWQIRHQWALPFPTTICPNLEAIIVLKTVYIVGSDSKGPESMESFRKNPSRSIIVPVQSSETTARASQQYRDLPGPCITPKPKLKAQTRDGSKALRVSYSYKFEISKSGRYILYKDSMEVSLPQHSEPAVTSLAVFELDATATKETCHMLSKIGDSAVHVSFSACNFHPTLPLVLLYSRSFVKESGIMLWAFARRSSRPPVSQNNFSHQEQLGPFNDAISLFRTTKGGVEILNFSACGTQIIVKLCGCVHPEVHSIESEPVYQWALQQSQGHKLSPQPSEKKNAENGGQTINTRRQDDELAVGLRPTLLELGKIEADKSALHKVVFSKYRSQHEIQIMNRSEGVEEVQSLVSLPDWLGIDNTHVSIHAPTTREERIKIVLNKAAQPWYNLSEDLDINLPAVVRKDTRALGRPQKRKIEVIDQ